MSAHSEIREGIAEAFNALNVEFFPDDQEVTLLKQSLTTRVFETVEVVSSNWFLENPTNFRDSFLLQIAEDWSLTDSIEAATHVQVGDRVFVIRKGDTIEPKGTSVMWQMFCDLYNERGQFKALY